MRQLFQSTTLWLMPYILLFSGLIWCIVELTFLRDDIIFQSDRLVVLNKLDTWAHQRPQKDDAQEKSVLFLSSSLGLVAANCADYNKYGQPDPNSQQALIYSKFKCLDDQFASLMNQRTQTINLSNSAALISEDLLLAREVLRLRGKPAMIILGIAPRDFLDHCTADYHRSRLAHILLTRLSPFWEPSKSFLENLDTALCKIWPFYSQRVEHRNIIIQLTCEYFHRSPDLFLAAQTFKNPTNGSNTKKNEGVPTPGKAFSDETAEEEALVKYDNSYRDRYLPIDEKRWHIELDSLHEFIDLCDEQEIQLVVVGMPLTERNRKLLPSAFLKEYNTALKAATTGKPTVHFINLIDDPQFLNSDYSDTVHLRSNGSKKLIEILIAEIKKGRWLQ